MAKHRAFTSKGNDLNRALKELQAMGVSVLSFERLKDGRYLFKCMAPKVNNDLPRS